MIEVRGLSFSYGEKPALQDINLKVEKRGAAAIIGPSGCGKTTLIYNLAGLLRPTSGAVLIDGAEITGIRRSTGVILQHFGLMPWKTVWGNVALGLIVRNVPKYEIERRVAEVLEQLQIAPLKHRYPAELSGGEKQRVGIARALAIEPDILLMDEPSSSLDAIAREHMQDLILRIHRQHLITMILVTHSIEEAVFLGQRIVLMGNARIKCILDNPYFGDDRLRESLDFYRVCLEVRKRMDAEHA